MEANPNAALYPQYKQDTKIVAQWLDATSKANGFVGSGAGHREAEGGIKRRYTIQIADFGRMADFLSHKENVLMPSYVSSSLSRAIRYRSTYGSYLQLQRNTTTALDETENKNHLFFIDVLRRVQSVLHRVSKPAAPVAPVLQTAPTGSRFASLRIPQAATVEDDTEDDASPPMQSNAPMQSNVSSEPSKDDVLFEPWVEDKEEAMFQWRLFNIDIQRIRKQISQLWELYRAGELSLSGVAIAHNIAILLAQKLEQAIKPVFEKYGGYRSMAATHFIRRYLGEAVNNEDMEARRSRLRACECSILGVTSEAIIDGFDIAEEEMSFASHILFRLLPILENFGTFSFYDGSYGWFRPRDDRDNLTSPEKYSQDTAIACEIILDLHLRTACVYPGAGMKLDELSVAIAEDLAAWNVKDTKKHYTRRIPLLVDKITFRAVFATQLLLDSIHVLGTSVDRPGSELVDKMARIFKSVKRLREFYKGSGPPALGSMPHVEHLERLAEFWQGGDPIEGFRRDQKMGVSERPPGHTLLRHNAPYCGWWMQMVQAISYNKSFNIANSLSLPLGCARLYFAFVQEKLVPEGSWPDMEAFSTLHRADLWVGAAPESHQYFKHIVLAAGQSVVGQASDARCSLPIIRSDRARHLTGKARVTQKILQVFSRGNVGFLSEGDLERLMADTNLRWYGGKPVRPLKADSKTTVSEAGNPFLRLAQTIDAELLEQSFDYMSLDRVCWMVLRELIKKGRPILEAATRSYLPKLPWKDAEGLMAYMAVWLIFSVVFPPDGAIRREAAAAIAEILLGLTKAVGRVVHTSTGIDWAEALKCTCADMPS
ncbi:hypothetical protein F4802DRAFT_613982 [Xylaria palmicola]|nr:hypothetical protein F4802DRAFT_613982 [Xylaria palmicola]